MPKGDTGAFSCIRSDGTTIVNVLDPPAQPWVTSVGGTSLENRQSGHQPEPVVPQGRRVGLEHRQPLQHERQRGRAPGLFWCGASGAGGGGNSQYWGRPFYQFGPGINNSDNTHANGTTQCSLAADGNAVPGGAGHLGQRRRIHAVRRVLHRQCRHAHTASAGRSAAASRHPDGSVSEAQACRPRCGRRSLPTATASRDSAVGT